MTITIDLQFVCQVLLLLFFAAVSASMYRSAQKDGASVGVWIGVSAFLMTLAAIMLGAGAFSKLIGF